jgi:hypothetical protein
MNPIDHHDGEPAWSDRAGSDGEISRQQIIAR